MMTAVNPIAQLVSLDGSSNVNFLQAGSGAQVRSVQSKLRDVVSVKDFGAKGDGVSDDTAAIQAAVNSVATSGGEVLFPNGSYRVNSTVVVGASDVQLCSAESALIINGTTNAPAIQFGDGVTIRYRGGIEGLTFAQASGVTPVGGNCGLRFAKWGQAQLSKLTFYEYPAALFIGLVLSEVSQTSLANVSVQGCTSAGITFSKCLDIYGDQIRSDANGAEGIIFIDHAGAYFSNSTLYGNATDGWKIMTSALAQCNDLFFINCIGDTSGIYNWTISDAKRVFLTNCWGATQLSTIANTYATGFILVDVETVGLTNCVGVYNNAHGLQIFSGSNITVNGGFYGTAQNPNGRADIFGSGIYVDTGVTDVLIQGANCSSNAAYGIALASSGLSRVQINGCSLRLNTIGQLENMTSASLVSNTEGVNPVNAGVTTPSVPATTVAATNTTGVNVMVYISGGTVSDIKVAGTTVFSGTNTAVFLPAGSSITLTYSVAPTWVWMGM
jgi:hypothetical protein